MTHADRITRELVAAHGFYDRELSDGALRIWLDVLAEFHPDAVTAALKAHLMDPEAGRYCPKPADVIRHIRGTADEAATLAWSDVLTAARNGGDVPNDPVVRAALGALGGLSVVRRADESQNGFLQARFTEAYRAFRHRHERTALVNGATLLAIAKGKR